MTSHSDVLNQPTNYEFSRVHASGIALATILSGTLLGFGTARYRNIHDESARKTAQVAAGPVVQTESVARITQDRSIKLLGETRPYESVTLYAKVSGYLGTISVDKGDVVKKGQILATIVSPETYNQYASAAADANNKNIMLQRVKNLRATGDVTQEEADQVSAQADMANARASELRAQRGYGVIQAPFDGTVTARYADPGALVQNAMNAQTSALPIVTVSQTYKLRITVYIDQRDAAAVQVGDPVEITMPEFPGVKYEAKVTRKSGQLDTRSRTMLTEIELNNENGSIVAGGFVDVTLHVKAPPSLQISSNALVIRDQKEYAAVISPDGILHYRNIKVGDNDGTHVIVLSGLKEGEVVGLNLGNALMDGQHVQAN